MWRNISIFVSQLIGKSMKRIGRNVLPFAKSDTISIMIIICLRNDKL